jgi:Cu(I)/Ag(I) efflux system membrane protein CusA/SilA
MWMFAVLLILAAGMFPLQAVFGQGASEEAWKTTFLLVFGLVTSLTVVFTKGKPGDRLSLVAGCALIAITAALIMAGLKLSGTYLYLPFIGNVAVLKWFLYGAAAAVSVLLFFIAFRVDSASIWRATSLSSLVWIGLWAYSFPKIGVAFMPALDEGTTLDMPITVPRASVTQSGDDLKARDALLRGFPEVESVIGKVGRADTPTDPAPLDMVETFVNFRPKELWPKRVLKYGDAAKQIEAVLTNLEEHGFVEPAATESDHNSFLVDASQKALERFDETMRDLALRRYSEFEQELGSALTRFAVADVVRRMRDTGDLAWPDGIDEEQITTKLTAELTRKYGHWLTKASSIEDTTALCQDVARRLAEVGAVNDVADSLELKRSGVALVASDFAELLGGAHPTFASSVNSDIDGERTRLWANRVREINWELFDNGTKAFTWYAIEEVVKGAGSAGRLPDSPQGSIARQFADAVVHSQLGQSADTAAFAPFEALRKELETPFAQRVFFWPRKTGPKGDLVDDEMGRVLQTPGWSNIFTQPIINRIEMLSTGVRTDIGIKVFGPDLDTIDRVCKDIEAAIKPINGARDTIAAPIMGKGYVQIDIHREQAARYGISVEDIQNEIEVALAGRAVTFTVEKRERFPVRIRYARSSRNDEESIRRLLVSAGSMSAAKASAGGAAGMSPPGGGEMSAADSRSPAVHTSTPAHAAKGKPLIPLSALADVRIVEGPAMIKSENGRLLNYVTLNVRGRDIVGFVDEAQRIVAQKVNLPEGVHIEWSGEFEHQVRAARTLRFVFPAVIALIFIILYMTYNDLADAGLMMLAVPEALAGGAFFMYLFPKIMQGWDAPPMDFSVAVWVGFIACFGMATETGIIMLVYLREAIEKRGGLENIGSLEELRQAVIEGAVHRLRPKLLTEGVAIIAIFPMVFAKGVGGEILAPMALPVLGGLLISDEVVDLFLPVRFYWVRRARWLKLHGNVLSTKRIPIPDPVSLTTDRVAV